MTKCRIQNNDDDDDDDGDDDDEDEDDHDDDNDKCPDERATDVSVLHYFAGGEGRMSAYIYQSICWSHAFL